MIEIEYCSACGYERRAVGLASHLKAALGVPVELKKGSGGAFEITVDGKVAFSKMETGRFPTEQEVVDELEDLLGWGR